MVDSPDPPCKDVREVPLLTSRERLALAGLLLLTLGLRVLRPGQPIVENYVGRQVPTAMVARNIERGSGFLRPQLDTGPFPNLFLVEPPIYAAAVVGLRRLTGLALEPSGRLVSALGMTLGGLGLFVLVRRREGVRTALLALAAFAVFPVTIRYGRAFQPDALTIGLLIAALACWDEDEASGGRRRAVLGTALLATALALKVVAAYILVPLIVGVFRPRRPWKVALAVGAIGAPLLWYLHAAALLAEGGGSRASADNGAIWLRVLVPAALFRAETLGHVARFLFVRAFTPVGIVLAAAGLLRPRCDRLWWSWGLAAASALAVLAAKLHHEYYWLVLAPVAAVGVGRSLSALADRRRCLAFGAGIALVVFALLQSRSTWRTPAEWAGLPEAARAIEAHVPRGTLIVAPEALLFASDRRGCRLEIAPSAARRAAGEWRGEIAGDDPLALIAFYRTRGARFVADVDDGDPAREALHDAIRGRYNVIVERRGVFLLAALNDSQDAPDGTR